MEITKREVLASVSIVAVMLLIGFLISGKIQNSIMDGNEQYNKAVKIENEELFQYGMDTNVGDAFVYGDLEAVDTVTYPEIGGEYIFVKKVEERRERHEEKITEKDSKGKEHTRIRVYYEWETENVESLHAKEIKFCGSTFSYNKIDLPSSKYIKTIPGDKVYSWECSISKVCKNRTLVLCFHSVIHKSHFYTFSRLPTVHLISRNCFYVF